MIQAAERIAAESERIRDEYRRRDRDVRRLRYAPWDPAEMLMRANRKRLAAGLLHGAHVFPGPGAPCLEVGCGRLGWLADLLTWGVREGDLSGIDLDASRLADARASLPAADLRVGDGTRLPWGDESFALVVTSTVFSSILDPEVRRLVAREVARVLRPGGALLWYDLRVDNPRNHQVRGIGRAELARLFPDLTVTLRSATLAPPLARLVAPRSWALATLIETIPLARTHFVGVLVKQA
jgi:ubiquinone/menaquinone biosynthesis C-methylase UbiE